MSELGINEAPRMAPRVEDAGLLVHAGLSVPVQETDVAGLKHKSAATRQNDCV